MVVQCCHGSKYGGQMENVNMACPKDSFPLSRIDQLVDATAGHELLSFMDAYSGYNQIRTHLADQESTRLSLLKAYIALIGVTQPKTRKEIQSLTG
ncbi:hypothetical protein L3X38_018303 [Prunus dulcis]|uniref:Transposable element protein n=1 Tax=Prunus dulcis TaxID=3755 RepID=A0AAD4WBB5_PRUDU|nr:hypothetical protein L3X38_018303 [Prunus dulcis]